MGKGDETRSMILRQGVETAFRVGLSGLTIGSLAETIGMSKSGLYAHVRSKEALQLAVLEQAREDFIDTVVRPAVHAPRGEPRARALFELWLTCGITGHPGGCLFHKAATELEGQYGPVRDQLIRDHRDLYDSIEVIAMTGVAEGHFHEGLDVTQFTFSLDGIMQAAYVFHHLLSDPRAEQRARTAFEALIVAARTGHDPAPIDAPPATAAATR